MWITEITTAKCKTIGIAKGFDEIGIELFDPFYGPVSLIRAVFRCCFDIVSAV